MRRDCRLLPYFMAGLATETALQAALGRGQG